MIVKGNGRSASPWTLVGGAFLTFATSSTIMNAYAVFFVAFLNEFGWSRADTALAFSVSQLVNGASSPVVGALVDRLGVRALVLGGGGILAASLALSARMSALWHMIVLYGFVMTAGASCLGLVVMTPLISRRFPARRGFTLAIVQSAHGLGRAVSVPIVQFLILAMGWRRSYLVLAAAMAVLVVPLSRFFRVRRAGADAPGVDSPARGPRPAGDWTLGTAMATSHFWLLFAVYLLTGLGSFFVSLHQLAFAVDVGFDPLYAAAVLGLGAFLSVFGTIFMGTISDYVGRELAAILAYGVSIVGVFAALFISGPQNRWLFWVHACFFGLTWGARGPMITAKTADLFQGPRLGTIFGVISIGTGLGAAVGSWASGLIFDLSGSYRLAFMLSIASYLLGCVAFWFLRRPPAPRG